MRQTRVRIKTIEDPGDTLHGLVSPPGIDHQPRHSVWLGLLKASAANSNSLWQFGSPWVEPPLQLPQASRHKPEIERRPSIPCLS